jgi:hypothetical protein
MSRCLVIILFSWLCCTPCLGAGPRVRVIHGDAAPPLERRATEDLVDILRRVYDAQVTVVAAAEKDASPTEPPRDANEDPPTIYVGSPQTNAAMKPWTPQWPRLSPQGICLRSVGEGNSTRLLLGGGSPVASYWAVHEYAHRLGVRSLLHGDLDPIAPPDFTLAGWDETREPSITTRAWDALTPLPYGRESAGRDEQRRLIRQLARQKYNHIVFTLQCWQPFFTFTHAGITSQTGLLWHGQRYPVDGDTAGRAAFAGATIFQNPEIPAEASYAERTAAAQSLLRDLIDAAHEHGMTVGLSIGVAELPPEFAGVASLRPSKRDPHRLTWLPDLSRRDQSAALRDLAVARLRATLATYPAIDSLQLRLNAELDWTNATATSFLSELLASTSLLAPTGAETPNVALEWEQSAGVVPANDSPTRAPNVVASGMIPWQWSGEAADAESMKPLEKLTAASPVWLTLRLSDDQLGVFPQTCHGLLEPSLAGLRGRAKSGVVAKAWMIGEQDVAAYLLGRSAYEGPCGVSSAIEALVTPVCGDGVAARVEKALEHLEQSSEQIARRDRSLGMPAEDFVARQMSIGEEAPAWWAEARNDYLEAMNEMYRANTRTREGSRSLTLYLARRAEFGYEWLNCLEAIRKAGVARAQNEPDEQIAQLETAIDAATSALNAMAAVARSSSDRGLIAQLNASVYRPLVQALDALDASEAEAEEQPAE